MTPVPIRILYVNGGVMDRGGITSFMMSYYRRFDDDRVRVDFLTQGTGANLYTDEIEGRNGKVFQIPNKGSDLLANIRETRTILKNGGYDIVHAHADAGNGTILAIAENCGVPVRISHSHSTRPATQTAAQKLTQAVQRQLIARHATEFWGCSKEACAYLYGANAPSKVIHNAIDLDAFTFNQAIRDRVRSELDLLEGDLAICQVGHLNYGKNHAFSLKVLSQMIKNTDRRIVFFIIGDGGEYENLSRQVTAEKLNDVVRFMGARADVALLLQGMDVLYLPSLSEGLPVSVVEGQTANLKCLVSDQVTDEIIIVPDTVFMLPISGEGCVEQWIENSNPLSSRSSKAGELRAAGYDIRYEASKMMDEYERLVRESAVK